MAVKDVLFYEDGILIEKDIGAGIAIRMMSDKGHFVTKTFTENSDSIYALNRLTTVLSKASGNIAASLKD